jgi:hypothetical protein
MWLDKLNSGGGHILVALVVFGVGVGLLLAGVAEGKEITVGAMASLWTVMRVGRDETSARQP